MLGLRARFACCALIVLMCVGSVAAQSRSNDAERLLARAVQLHESGDIEGAIREYKAFLTIRPEVMEARSNLGAAFARLGRYEEAIEQYKLALALQPGNTQVRFNLGVAYYKTALLSDAVQEFERIAAADSSNKNVVLLLADCHLQAGDYKKVIKLLEPIRIERRDDLTVAYMLGTAYIRDDQLERGQGLVDLILRNGESAEARLMMGTARLMIRDYPGAVKEFERAIELNPKLPMARSIYGKALLGAGERERAATAFHGELETNPNDFDANIHIGMILKEDQQYDESIKYLTRALSLRPRDLNALYFVANVNLALGRTVEAQRLLEDVVKQAPEFVEAHVSLATVYYRLKRKADGDRERAIILKLNAERQAQAPGAKDGLGPAYRGEPMMEAQPVRKPETKPQQ